MTADVPAGPWSGSPPLPEGHDSEAWLQTWYEHRDLVRHALEDAGLCAAGAERLVGAVFTRFAAEGADAEGSTVDRLRAHSRHIAHRHLAALAALAVAPPPGGDTAVAGRPPEPS